MAKILDLVRGKKDEKKKGMQLETWEKLRDVVDKIFEETRGERDKMDKNLDHFNGKIWNEGELRADETKAIHNLVFSTVQSIAPTMSDNRPIWSVIARYPMMQKLANAYDMALKYGWDKNEMNMVVHKVVMDAMIMKIGLFYVYYNFEEDEWCVEEQDPREFFIAPGYSDPWKAPFCGVKSKKPLSLLREMFPDAEDLKPDGNQLDDYTGKGISFGDAADFELDSYFATLYVVWMRDNKTEAQTIQDLGDGDEDEKPKEKEKAYPNGKFVYFTKDKYLGTVASDFLHGKPPWVPYYNYIKPHDFLGIAEVDNIKEMAKEFNLQFQKIVGHTRKYSDPNFFMDISQGIEIEKVKETWHKGGQTYPFDSSSNPNANREPVHRADVGPVIPEVYNIMNIIPKLIEEESGATDVSKGVASKKQRQSASEVAILVESSYTRTRQRVRNLEWSLKRVCWLIVNLMQQYYDKMRPVHVKKDDEVMSDMISNSNAFATTAMITPETMQKGAMGQPLSPREQEEYEDYQKFSEIYGEKDPVYFDFDIEIQTNSSLPLDKQSLANLAVRLFQMKAIDRKALLETLQFPHWEEIATRLDQLEMAARQPQGPPGGAQAPPEGNMGGQTPLDLADRMANMVPQGAGNE